MWGLLGTIGTVERQGTMSATRKGSVVGWARYRLSPLSQAVKEKNIKDRSRNSWATMVVWGTSPSGSEHIGQKRRIVLDKLKRQWPVESVQRLLLSKDTPRMTAKSFFGRQGDLVLDYCAFLYVVIEKNTEVWDEPAVFSPNWGTRAFREFPHERVQIELFLISSPFNRGTGNPTGHHKPV